MVTEFEAAAQTGFKSHSSPSRTLAFWLIVLETCVRARKAHVIIRVIFVNIWWPYPAVWYRML
jgi:hypothetical protein